MKGRKWTKEEEEYLTEKYYKVSHKTLEKKLNRNIKAIQQKALRMGLSTKKWTKEEEDFLKNNWGRLKLKSICKALGRTERAVQERACSKLKLGSQLQWYSLLEIERMTGINKDTIKNRIVRYNLPHWRGKTKQKPYMMDEEQLRRFLKENKDLWHHKNLTINFFKNEAWYLEKIEADKKITKKHNKHFTKEEDFIMLDRLKDGYDFEFIGRELNRTADSVYNRYRFKYKR